MCHIKDEDEYLKFQSRYNCLKDIDNFTECLQDIGMIDLKCDNKRSDVCVFTDSMSGNLCKLSVDSGMLYEREKLIGAYLDLDKRIRPLINVILYFCKCHGLKKGN